MLADWQVQLAKLREEDDSLKFAHSVSYISSRGKTKAVCVCGWQGTKRDSFVEAKKEYDGHTGLSFQKERPKGE